jgi:hypothetical protein
MPLATKYRPPAPPDHAANGRRAATCPRKADSPILELQRQTPVPLHHLVGAATKLRTKTACAREIILPKANIAAPGSSPCQSLVRANNFLAAQRWGEEMAARNGRRKNDWDFRSCFKTIPIHSQALFGFASFLLSLQGLQRRKTPSEAVSFVPAFSGSR